MWAYVLARLQYWSMLAQKDEDKLLNMALPDAPVITGTSQEVFDYYGLNAEGIAKKAVEALK